MFYVYILQNLDNKDDLYLGYSSDLKRRLKDHNSGRNPSTKGRKWQVVYYEAYITEQAARERETRLKNDGRVRRFLRERLMPHIS
jgi:putative endonuclease